MQLTNVTRIAVCLHWKQNMANLTDMLVGLYQCNRKAGGMAKENWKCVVSTFSFRAQFCLAWWPNSIRSKKTAFLLALSELFGEWNTAPPPIPSSQQQWHDSQSQHIAKGIWVWGEEHQSYVSRSYITLVLCLKNQEHALRNSGDGNNRKGRNNSNEWLEVST